MLSESSLHNRRSVRLPGYDYREEGGYFVTICTAGRRLIFSRIENGVLRLHRYGQIVTEEWERTAAIRPEVVLSNYVVMPNHFHGIVLIRNVGAHGNAPSLLPIEVLQEASGTRAHCHAPLRAPRSLSTLISGFKGSVTRRINMHRAERDLSPVIVWQRNYYERIIRDEKELHETQRYIIENPLYWAQDELYSAQGFSK